VLIQYYMQIILIYHILSSLLFYKITGHSLLHTAIY